jgi:hypothetical protein
VAAEASAIFERLLGTSPVALAQSLLSKAQLEIGFESQEIGKGQPSIASSGAVLYALGSVPDVPDDLLEPWLADLESWIREDGSMGAPGVSMAQQKTSWAASQCLCALTMRPGLIHNPKRARELARHVRLRQMPSGGWPLRTGSTASQPLLCVYPLIGLVRSFYAGLVASEDLHDCLAKLVPYLVMTLEEGSGFGVGDQLVTAYCLQRISRVMPGLTDDDLLSARVVRLERDLWRDGDLHLAPDDVLVSEQPLWHLKPNQPLYYLFARRFWEPAHPIAAVLGERLVSSFNTVDGGWRNDSGSGAIYSWTTALGLLGVYRLSYDLRASSVDVPQWRDQARERAAGRPSGLQPSPDELLSAATSLAPTARHIRRDSKRWWSRSSSRIPANDAGVQPKWWLPLAVAIITVFGVLGAALLTRASNNNNQPERIGKLALTCSKTELARGDGLQLVYSFDFIGDESKEIGLGAALVSSSGLKVLDPAHDVDENLGAGGARELRRSFQVPELAPGTYRMDGTIWFGRVATGKLQAQASCPDPIVVR